MMSRRTLFVVAASSVVTILVIALLVNIFERRQEAQDPFFRVVKLTENIDDPAVWARNFPLQYDTYQRTVDQERTRYGGSEALRHAPTEADPRSSVSRNKLAGDPRLKIMWAGYAFAVDFREERGHAYMLTDQRFTRRVQEFSQPGTCLNCHASTYVTYRELGNGDIFAGFEKLNRMPYQEATKLVSHPVACIDCHHPETMQLRITRPAFIEGIKALKASEGVKDYDVNSATAQEMRTYVCAQCHVEYYFKGDEKRLVFPWTKGLKVEDALAYYNEQNFRDWVHAETKAPVLKAQHPEFEIFSQGVHARSGVACADCHMPYQRHGGLKISDHHVRSPLLNINRACQTCHHFSEEELKARAEDIQVRFGEARDRAMDALVELIFDIRDAMKDGRAEEDLNLARSYQRSAQFYIDYVEAENSMGFHASAETLRILVEALDHARRGQLAVRGIKARPLIRAEDAPDPKT
ncbi:MAG: ammonia-forming cytochrome c nitrite reductase subunit c552 [Acidobacteria bacterium]|nr:ammonia-forming cytochrome c nitrite reductase subunit c552 [Acidobacteriota bacterium]